MPQSIEINLYLTRTLLSALL